MTYITTRENSVLDYITEIVADAKKSVHTYNFDFYPLFIGMTDASHTIRRFAERGGVGNGKVLMEEVKASFQSFPELIEVLLELHEEVENSKKSIVVKMFDGKVYVLQNAGFVEYTETFDLVTFFDENAYHSKFRVNKNTNVILYVSSNGKVNLH